MTDSPIYSIACDFGSSGGKIYLGCLSEGRMEVEELHRFACEPIALGDLYYTDALYLYRELIRGLKVAIARGISPQSLAINTWGVDVAYVTQDGELVANPVNYRSARTAQSAEKLAQQGLGSLELYQKTGIAPMPYNTLFQVYEDMRSRKSLLAAAHKMLWLPDLFAYWLTGKMSTEPCIASTSQMLCPKSLSWDADILAAAGLDASLLPEIQPTGSLKGMLREDLAAQLGCAPFAVLAAASHDTASAVLAAPLQDERSLYISSGSWSLIGQLRQEPILSQDALDAGFANELGYGASVRFLKSLNGLWTLQQLQRQWGISFNEIEQGAREAMGQGFVVDVNDAAFYSASDMQAAIIAHCEQKQLPIPQSKGQIAAAVYEGLGRAHAQAVAEVEKITGETASSLHLLGGGCRDKLFCETIERHTKLPMTLGPVDATSAGNLLSQWLGLGYLKSVQEARECVRKSFT